MDKASLLWHERDCLVPTKEQYKGLPTSIANYCDLREGVVATKGQCAVNKGNQGGLAYSRNGSKRLRINCGGNSPGSASKS